MALISRRAVAIGMLRSAIAFLWIGNIIASKVASVYLGELTDAEQPDLMKIF
jgi:hypothetical protein